jgi:hypothetical protein
MNADVGELLRDGIERLTAGAHTPAGLAERACRQHRQRRRVVRAAVAASTAAVAAATAAVIVAAGVAVGGQPAHRTAGPAAPQVRNAAYLVRHIERALTGASGRIMYESTYGMPAAYGGHRPLIDFWSYRGVTKSEKGLDGKALVVDAERISGGMATDVIVDYSNKTWWRSVSASSPLSYALSGCVGPADDYPDPGTAAWAPYVRRTLACGGYRIAGKARIGGQDVIKIIGTAKDLNSRYVPQTFFVSATTYLLIRELIPFGHRDFRWLRPTSANLALLKITIPAGFRHVRPPR